MSAADQWAEDMIKRFGLPRSEEFYRALLEYAFSSGQVQGAVGSQHAIEEAFHKLDASKVPA